MSLPGSVWGKSGWKFLHYITLTYPEKPSSIEKNDFQNIITALTTLLPCPRCKTHLKNYLKTYPLTEQILSIKFNLIMWVHELHNLVNLSIHKPVLSFEDAMVGLFADPNTDTVSPLKVLLVPPQLEESQTQKNQHDHSNESHEYMDNPSVDHILENITKNKKYINDEYVVQINDIYIEYQKMIDNAIQLDIDSKKGEKLFESMHSAEYLEKIKALKKKHLDEYNKMIEHLTASNTKPQQELQPVIQKSINIKQLIAKFISVNVRFLQALNLYCDAYDWND